MLAVPFKESLENQSGWLKADQKQVQSMGIIIRRRGSA
jgi:hypothetical protein